MILKKHTHPPNLLMLDCLLRRLPQDHPKHSVVSDRLERLKAGAYGESRLHYALSKLDFKHFTLYDIRLPFNRTFFQMDNVLITPRFILILETKAYSGKVTFRNDFQQTVQQKNSDSYRKVYDNPITQVEEQKFQLTTWLDEMRTQPLPIETLVVMTHPHVQLQATGNADFYKNKIIPLSQLSSKIREMNRQFRQEFMNLREARNLANKMTKAHTPHVPDILKSFKIDPSEIIPGVTCPECQQLGMERISKRWECIACGHRSADAHLNAMKDYFLLGNKEITNAEFRAFTGVESASTAKRMLKNCSKEFVGNTSDRKYIFDYDFEKDFKIIK